MQAGIIKNSCNWSKERWLTIFAEIAGITAVMSGDSGGRTVNPTYYEVCSEKTGHAEVVQLEFDPCQITYSEMLEVFFAT